jgi:two-component system, OmpR family, sensor histidine kinase BaeS
MRLKLMLSFSFVVLVAIFSMVIIVRQNANLQVRNFMFRGGMIGMEGLVNSLEQYYRVNGSWHGAGELLASGRMMKPGNGPFRMVNQRLRVADPSGQVVIDTNGFITGEKATSNELNQAIILQNQAGQKIGYLLIQGGMPVQSGDEISLVNRIGNAALQAGLIALVIALGLAVILANQLIKPIEQLTRAAKQMTAGNRSQLVNVTGNDELATLGRSFNTMVESLRKSEDNRKAITAEIAHELRTPLAVQRAYLEALQDGIYPLTIENLNPVIDQTVLLTRLVEDLRMLALTDAGELKLENTSVDVNDLVDGVVNQFILTSHKNVQLILNLVQTANHPLVLGDPDRLVQILNNLLSNALHYTPEESAIEVAIKTEISQVKISVRDHGPGILPEDLPNLFTRFYRVNRSQNQDEGSTGLGLSIARGLAVAHGGDLTAANHPEGGAVFTLILPLN